MKIVEIVLFICVCPIGILYTLLLAIDLLQLIKIEFNNLIAKENNKRILKEINFATAKENKK